MANEKQLEFVEQLRSKTAAGALRWEAAVDEGAFQVAFRGYVVQLSRRQFDDRHGFVLTILNDRGLLVREIFGEPRGPAQSSEFIAMQELYNRVQHEVLQPDQAIDDLLRQLAKTPTVPS